MLEHPRLARLINEYLVDLNGTQAALRAGYSPNGVRVQACRMEIRREDIVRGLLQTIEMARQQGDAQATIRAAAEINKMLGVCAPRGKRGEALRGAGEEDPRRLSSCWLLPQGKSNSPTQKLVGLLAEVRYSGMISRGIHPKARWFGGNDSRQDSGNKTITNQYHS